MNNKNVVIAIVWIVIIAIAGFAIYIAYENNQKVKRLRRSMDMQIAMYPNMMSDHMMHSGMTKADKEKMIKHEMTCPYCAMKMMHTMNPMMSRYMMLNGMMPMVDDMMNTITMFPDGGSVKKELNDIFNNPRMIRSTGFMVENDSKEFRVSAIFNKNVRKDMLHISIDNGFLKITVKQKEARKRRSKRHRKHKENYAAMTSINRVIRLPKNIDIEKYKMTFKDSTLVISIPKTEAETSESIRLNF